MKRHPLLIDAAVVLLLTAFGVSVSLEREINLPHTPWDTLLIPLIALPVLLRRRAPVLAMTALAAGVLVGDLPEGAQLRCGVIIVAGLLIVYSAASRREAREAGVAAGLFAGILLYEAHAEFEGDVLGLGSLTVPLMALALAGGRFVRSRDRLAAELRERSAQLRLRREQTARLAVEVERHRLAADLDVAARQRLRRLVELAAAAGPADPDATRQRFAQIEREGRESLNQMRGLLGVLRSDQARVRPPQPTLAQLEALLARARAGGRVVDLAVDGERRPLPDSLELAAYRMVESGLAALGGDGRVRLRYGAEELELEVSGAAARGEGAEEALIAVRERAAAHGGSLEVTTGPAGAQALVARIPLVPAHV